MIKLDYGAGRHLWVRAGSIDAIFAAITSAGAPEGTRLQIGPSFYTVSDSPECVLALIEGADEEQPQ